MPTPKLLSACPAILEWLDSVPDEHHRAYKLRAERLLADCGDSPVSGALCLRIMTSERRLGLWTRVAEHTRGGRNSQPKRKAALREALKSMEAAERDVVRAWDDYRRECAPAPRAAGAPTASQLVG